MALYDCRNEPLIRLFEIAATHAAPTPCNDGRGANLDKALGLDDSDAFFDRQGPISRDVF